MATRSVGPPPGIVRRRAWGRRSRELSGDATRRGGQPGVARQVVDCSEDRIDGEVRAFQEFVLAVVDACKFCCSSIQTL